MKWWINLFLFYREITLASLWSKVILSFKIWIFRLWLVQCHPYIRDIDINCADVEIMLIVGMFKISYFCHVCFFILGSFSAGKDNVLVRQSHSLDSAQVNLDFFKNFLIHKYPTFLKKPKTNYILCIIYLV